GAGPAAPADQPTISAETVSQETEQSFVTLVAGLRLVFLTICALRARDFEREIMRNASIKMTLATRSVRAKKGAPIISQPAGIKPPHSRQGRFDAGECAARHHRPLIIARASNLPTRSPRARRRKAFSQHLGSW